MAKVLQVQEMRCAGSEEVQVGLSPLLGCQAKLACSALAECMEAHTHYHAGDLAAADTNDGRVCLVLLLFQRLLKWEWKHCFLTYMRCLSRQLCNICVRTCWATYVCVPWHSLIPLLKGCLLHYMQSHKLCTLLVRSVELSPLSMFRSRCKKKSMTFFFKNSKHLTCWFSN